MQNEEEKYFKLFGQRLKRIRAEKQISQEKLADLSSLTPTYISKLESGTENPSLRTIVRLSISLNIPPSKFLDEPDILV
jgi:transcriptional regulator with XRE-family HTH domain